MNVPSSSIIRLKSMGWKTECYGDQAIKVFMLISQNLTQTLRSIIICTKELQLLRCSFSDFYSAASFKATSLLCHTCLEVYFENKRQNELLNAVTST